MNRILQHCGPLFGGLRIPKKRCPEYGYYSPRSPFEHYSPSIHDLDTLWFAGVCGTEFDFGERLSNKGSHLLLVFTPVCAVRGIYSLEPFAQE